MPFILRQIRNKKDQADNGTFHTGPSKSAPFLQFFFVCASVISYKAFVIAFFVPHLDFSTSFGSSEGLCFVIVAFLGAFTYICTHMFALSPTRLFN